MKTLIVIITAITLISCKSKKITNSQKQKQIQQTDSLIYQQIQDRIIDYQEENPHN